MGKRIRKGTLLLIGISSLRGRPLERRWNMGGKLTKQDTDKTLDHELWSGKLTTHTAE